MLQIDASTPHRKCPNVATCCSKEHFKTQVKFKSILKGANHVGVNCVVVTVLSKYFTCKKIFNHDDVVIDVNTQSQIHKYNRVAKNSCNYYLHLKVQLKVSG